MKNEDLKLEHGYQRSNMMDDIFLHTYYKYHLPVASGKFHSNKMDKINFQSLQ
jgi:hypothetical protein